MDCPKTWLKTPKSQAHLSVGVHRDTPRTVSTTSMGWSTISKSIGTPWRKIAMEPKTDCFEKDIPFNYKKRNGVHLCFSECTTYTLLKKTSRVFDRPKLPRYLLWVLRSYLGRASCAWMRSKSPDQTCLIGILFAKGILCGSWCIGRGYNIT